MTSSTNTSAHREPFSLIAKPAGAACNLDCAYCFFLSKEVLADGGRQQMTDAMLRTWLAAFLDAQPDGDVTVLWQGGEPTLRGVGFFREAVRLASELARPTQRVRQAIQTNATLIDDDWAAFLAEHGFLVGVSIDGPALLHDAHRVNRAGRGTHAQVVRGWRTLQRHGVETNVLCTVNAVNADHPLEVYRYLRDDLGARFLQFIPIVERVEPGQEQLAEAGWRDTDGRFVLYTQRGTGVTSRTVRPAQWGAFMTAIFDEWVRHDVGTVFVQHMDVMLGNLFGQYQLCVHAPECGMALAVEHDGEVYACDHYVEPAYGLGNIADRPLGEMLHDPRQVAFGQAKRTALPAQCRQCPVRWACHGGCPKDRIATTRDGEPGLNWLCEGYYSFFSHAAPLMGRMAELLRAGQPPARLMDELAAWEARR